MTSRRCPASSMRRLCAPMDLVSSTAARSWRFFVVWLTRRPVIVLTDSDGAGRVIRNFIHSVLPAEKIIDLYTPAVAGKEKRKKTASKAGILGVEGTAPATLRALFTPYADPDAASRAAENPLSKTDFYLDGLSGGENSQARRDELAAALSLPPGMSATALLVAVRCVCSYAEYQRIVAGLRSTPQ